MISAIYINPTRTPALFSLFAEDDGQIEQRRASDPFKLRIWGQGFEPLRESVPRLCRSVAGREDILTGVADRMRREMATTTRSGAILPGDAQARTRAMQPEIDLGSIGT